MANSLDSRERRETMDCDRHGEKTRLRLAVLLALICLVLTQASPIGAQPGAGLGLELGTPLGDQGADWHFGLQLDGHIPVSGPWAVSPLVATTLEGFYTGPNCGICPGGICASIGVLCLQPTIGLFGTVSGRAALGAAARFEAQAGPGAQVIWLVPMDEGSGGPTVLRGAVLLRTKMSLCLGVLSDGRVWLGVQASEMAWGWRMEDTAFSVGFVVDTEEAKP
jgi:hypothetical protein